MMDEIPCKQCGDVMSQSTQASSNILLQLVGVVIFLLGLPLLLLFPFGTIFGVIMIVGAARLGYSKKRIWKCNRCGYFFERV